MASTWGTSWGTSWATSWDRGVVPPIVLDTRGGIGKRRRKLEQLLREQDEAKRRDREELRGIIADAVDPPVVAAEVREVVAPVRRERRAAPAPAVEPLAAPLGFDLRAAMDEAAWLAELDDEETLLALLGP